VCGDRRPRRSVPPGRRAADGGGAYTIPGGRGGGPSGNAEFEFRISDFSGVVGVHLGFAPSAAEAPRRRGELNHLAVQRLCVSAALNPCPSVFSVADP